MLKASFRVKVKIKYIIYHNNLTALINYKCQTKTVADAAISFFKPLWGHFFSNSNTVFHTHPMTTEKYHNLRK